VNVKLIIQSEKAALQKVEDTFTSGKEAFDASIIEAERLEAAEIAAAAEVVAIRERYNARVQQMTAEWNRKQAELQTQVKEIEARLKRQHEFLAPVKWLPSEVLSEIFTIHVDCGDTPWMLLRVCRLWKAVTSSTPRIWRYIQITAYEDQRRFDSGTSFQMCFTNADFGRALSRTGAAPLCISIARRWHVKDMTADSDRLYALFDTLTKVLNRCDTIELKETRTPFSTKCQKLFATLQFPMPFSLKCLRVGPGWERSGIVQKIFITSNHESSALRELSIAADGNRSLVDCLANHRILLNRLTSFSTDGFEVPTDVFALMQCLSYFSQSCRSLILPQASSIFNLLQEAQFQSATVEALGTYQFGNLRKLVIRQCTMPDTIIKIPILDTLIFENWSWLPILKLDCPLVSHLELEGGCWRKTESKKEVDQIWGPGERFAHLKFLKINLVMSDTVLITILKKSVALEHLFITLGGTMKAGGPGDTFFNSLLVKNTRRLGFLPGLRTLILQCDQDFSRSESVLVGLRTGLQRVVRSRQQSTPLRSAILQDIERGWHSVLRFNKEEFVVCEDEQ